MAWRLLTCDAVQHFAAEATPAVENGHRNDTSPRQSPWDGRCGSGSEPLQPLDHCSVRLSGRNFLSCRPRYCPSGARWVPAKRACGWASSKLIQNEAMPDRTERCPRSPLSTSSTSTPSVHHRGPRSAGLCCRSSPRRPVNVGRERDSATMGKKIPLPAVSPGGIFG